MITMHNVTLTFPDGGTRVRETWDITGESFFTKPAVRRAAEVTRKNMAATLERIEKLVVDG